MIFDITVLVGWVFVNFGRCGYGGTKTMLHYHLVRPLVQHVSVDVGKERIYTQNMNEHDVHVDTGCF